MKPLGFIITAGHLDIEWYQPLRSYRFWTIAAFEDLRRAAARGDFKTYVLDGQVFPLEEYLAVAPEEEEAVRGLIAQGKLAIGPFYTQFDEWIPSAESMIRNCLWGRRRAEAFGGCMKAGYLPDNFGHPAQLPQILRGFGIHSLLFMRGMPEIEGGHPDEFLLEGPDGSRVLASHFRESYSGAFDLFNKDIDPIQPREVPYYPDYLSFEYHRELADHDDPQRVAKSMVQNVRRILGRYPSRVVPLIAGYDHLPPQINIGDSVRAANEMQDEIEFVMGTAEEYVRAVQARAAQPTVYRMELLGSRYQYILLGALSTRTYLKRQHFACEALLERYAEPLDAVASLHGYRDKPRLLEEAWQNILLNSAHDSIHGSSVDEVHTEMEARYAAARQIASGVIHEALAHLGRHCRRWWQAPARGMLTYAPVEAPFAQPAEVWLPIGEGPVCIQDESGARLPTQVLPRAPIALNGIGLPRNDAFPDPVYRKVLFLTHCRGGETVSHAAVPAAGGGQENLAAGDGYIDNGLLRVEARGALLNLRDLRTGKQYCNLNLLEEEADAGDAWDFAPPWVPGETVRSTAFRFESRLAECGPVRARLEISGELEVPACLEGDVRSARRVKIPAVFTVTLWRGIARADVGLRLENNARDHRIRLRVPAGVRTGAILSQGHLAVLERPIARPQENERWRQPPTQLLPCREWVAACDGKNGLAIALRGLYDYEAAINPLSGEPELCFTLLRGFELMGRRNTLQRGGAASEAFDTPGAQCLGAQEIAWSYIPYQAAGDERAPFLPLAQSFLYPPVCHAIRGEAGPGDFGRLEAPVRWEAANIQFSAFKSAWDRDGLLLRVYENQGRAGKVRFTTAFTRAALCDLNERETGKIEICGGAFDLEVGAYQALTIKLA